MRSFLFALLTMCLPTLVQADTIYRWVDKSGIIHYSNKPPAHAENAKPVIHMAPVQPAAPTASTPAAAPAQSSPAASPDAQTRSAASPNPQLGLIQRQLQLARLDLVAALKAYEEGKAVRLGNERNYARYLDRVNALQTRVRLAQERVLLLEQEVQAAQAGKP